MLGNISLCGTALDRALLLTSNASGFLQVIGQVGDTTHELAMLASAFGACRNKISDRASAREHGVGDLAIAAVDDHRGTQSGIGALILIVRHAITVCVLRGGEFLNGLGSVTSKIGWLLSHNWIRPPVKDTVSVLGPFGGLHG
jgi:hypothetical protein